MDAPRLRRSANFMKRSRRTRASRYAVAGEGEVYAEPVLFRRALINLITNALRFTSSGGSVTVALVRRNGESNVSVTDTGCGISSHHIPHVFNRFFRGDAPRNSHGTGLGLAIVKSIMQIHEGDVLVQSELNKGTVVTLIFPGRKNQRSRHARIESGIATAASRRNDPVTGRS